MGNRIFLLIFLVQGACATIYQSSSNGHDPVNDKLMKVSLGQSADQLREALGSPSSISTEAFSATKYEVWEYPSPKFRPSMFFTLDAANNRVAGRSVEFYDADAVDISQVLKKHFKDNNFDRKYAPCHSRGQEEVLVDSRSGIFIATRDGKVLMISWAEPQLANLRVQDFYLKCPKLQPPRK